MQSYNIWTIGCQMNKAYSEQLASDLSQLGLHEAGRIEEADLVVVNSCVVRQSAENRVIARLNYLKQLKRRKTDLLVALTGCIVEPDIPAMRYRFPQVDILLKPGESAQLLELVQEKAPDSSANSRYRSKSVLKVSSLSALPKALGGTPCVVTATPPSCWSAPSRFPRR